MRSIKSAILLYAIILLFSTSMLNFGHTTASDHLVINELDQNPPGNDNYLSVKEWVELYNPTSEAIDISSWTLSTTHGETVTVSIPASTIIEANGYYVFSRGSQWLDNDDEAIILRDAEGNIVDVTPTLSDDDNDDWCWLRYPNGLDTDSYTDWRFQTSTMGASNGGEPSPPIPEPDPEPEPEPEFPPLPPLPPILSYLTIIPAEVESGHEVTIGLDIENIDSQSFTYMVTMQIGELTLLVDVELGAYESKTVSRTITPDMVGVFNVTVDGMTGSFTVNPVPTPPRPAEFEASNLQITPEEAETGEEIEISFTVTNVGEETGNYSFSLMIEGHFALEIVEMVGALGAGESETTTHTLTREKPGRYTVTTYGLTGSFVLSEPLILPTPAEFVLSELEALGRQALIHDDEGRPIVEGEYVIFSVLVINIGETEGTYTVEFKLLKAKSLPSQPPSGDGETIRTQNVTLAAGSGRYARIYFVPHAGTYQVSVGNLTEIFDVRAPLEPAELVFSNLQITQRVEEGALFPVRVTISVDVTNIGEEMGGCTMELKLDGEVVDSVYIQPFGGVYPDYDQVTATQFFELTRSAGTYDVEVEGLTGSFTVARAEPSFWDKIPGFPYESIIIGLIAVIIIIWRARNL